MRVDRSSPAQLGAEALDVAVVIDVLRATSTAAVLLSKGASALAVIATPDELSLLPRDGGPYLYVSEISRVSMHGERIDNSPAQAEKLTLAGRTPVLITTNGTRTLDAAASRARLVIAASFLNATAVCEALVRAAPARVTIVPAGGFEKGDTRIEDELCADALQQLLEGARPDLAAIAARCRSDERILRRLSREAGFAADLELSLTPDLHPVVPTYSANRTGYGWLRSG